MKTLFALFVLLFVITGFQAQAVDSTKAPKTYKIYDSDDDSVKFKSGDHVVTQLNADSTKETGRTRINKAGKKEYELVTRGRTFWMQEGYKLTKDPTDPSLLNLDGYAGDTSIPTAIKSFFLMFLCLAGIGLVVYYRRRQSIHC